MTQPEARSLARALRQQAKRLPRPVVVAVESELANGSTIYVVRYGTRRSYEPLHPQHPFVHKYVH